jgi:hypothetical protein
MFKRLNPKPEEKLLRLMERPERRAIIERVAPMLGISVRTERQMFMAEKELANLTKTGLEMLLIDQAHRDRQSQTRPVHQTGEYDPYAKVWEP